ncbi:hypothetical protein KM043_011214 [Ampulex compressa]|nr:hypothetical protein KM043_011214 [Ampulex compressa]
MPGHPDASATRALDDSINYYILSWESCSSQGQSVRGITWQTSKGKFRARLYLLEDAKPMDSEIEGDNGALRGTRGEKKAQILVLDFAREGNIEGISVNVYKLSVLARSLLLVDS